MQTPVAPVSKAENHIHVYTKQHPAQQITMKSSKPKLGTQKVLFMPIVRYFFVNIKGTYGIKKCVISTFL